MNNPTFDPSVLRQRLSVQHGIHPDRDPADYQHSAEVLDLTPDALGYDRFAVVLHRLRAVADAATGGDYALLMSRDPVTHQRRGYRVYARQQTTADQIADTVRGLVP